ncbi:MAG: hypothetical protein KDI50_05500 [Candidatus Competibacteraceae bacterium]|nr:hypothetical protein [Candidatus Competibacteraceae bacterium]
MPNAPLNPAVSSHSRPVLCVPVELATHLGLKAYNRTFARIEAALFLADVIVQLQGRASRSYADEIDQVQEAIHEELERLNRLATEQANQVNKLGNGGKRRPAPAPPDLKIAYTQPTRVELTLRTPQVRRYATLLAELEAMSRHLDQAWWDQQIPTARRLELENRLFRHCMKAAGVIERLARGLARRIRDDQEAPGYREMLVKRTGRGPDAAAVLAEGSEAMTADEAASLQATEALTVSLQATETETVEATVRPAETTEATGATQSATDIPDGGSAEAPSSETPDADADANAEPTATVLGGGDVLGNRRY